jgi:hypothetical protein
MAVVAEQEQADELPERWSAKAKSDVVLRLLRGEAVDAVSREIQVPALLGVGSKTGGSRFDSWRACQKIKLRG